MNQTTSLKDIIKKKSMDRPLCVPCLTCGDPDLKHTVEFSIELIRAGADILELIVPFTDSVPTGETLLQSMRRAVQQQSFSIEHVFESIKQIHAESKATPLMLTVYTNLIFATNGNLKTDSLDQRVLGMQSRHSKSRAERLFAAEDFLKRAYHAGVSALLVPDLPHDARETAELSSVMERYGMDRIFLLTPNTSTHRFRQICDVSSSFIYYDTSTFALQEELPHDLHQKIQYTKAISSLPVFVGCGVGRLEQIQEIAESADGVIPEFLYQSLIEKEGVRAREPLYRLTVELIDILKTCRKV